MTKTYFDIFDCHNFFNFKRFQIEQDRISRFALKKIKTR